MFENFLILHKIYRVIYLYLKLKGNYKQNEIFEVNIEKNMFDKVEIAV